jgi:DNA-binding transcriptional ArsR family regulator
MSTPFEEIAGLDRLVHDPTRLAILTALAACTRAEFLFLQRLTGLTKGNLSAHLAKLEDAGLVIIEKAFVDKKPRTFARLSDGGQREVAAYWERIERLREEAARWKPLVPEPAGVG